MGDFKSGQTPFRTLGTRLKMIREKLSESLAEVSGAVEIDLEHLERIEAGMERPAEDVLMLLLSHFNMKDKEAVRLWEMAGYRGEVPDQITIDTNTDDTEIKPVVMLLAMDARTVYTDGLDISCNQSGVTLAFNQSGKGSQKTSVAKLGMSYEQAGYVLQSLQQALLKAKYMRGPRQLPPSGS